MDTDKQQWEAVLQEMRDTIATDFNMGPLGRWFGLRPDQYFDTSTGRYVSPDDFVDLLETSGGLTLANAGRLRTWCQSQAPHSRLATLVERCVQGKGQKEAGPAPRVAKFNEVLDWIQYELTNHNLLGMHFGLKPNQYSTDPGRFVLYLQLIGGLEEGNAAKVARLKGWLEKNVPHSAGMKLMYEYLESV